MTQRIKRHRNSITNYEKAEVVDNLVVMAYAMETGVSYRWLLTGVPPQGDDPVTPSVTSR